MNSLFIFPLWSHSTALNSSFRFFSSLLLIYMIHYYLNSIFLPIWLSFWWFVSFHYYFYFYYSSFYDFLYLIFPLLSLFFSGDFFFYLVWVGLTRLLWAICGSIASIMTRIPTPGKFCLYSTGGNMATLEVGWVEFKFNCKNIFSWFFRLWSNFSFHTISIFFLHFLTLIWDL